MHFCSSNTLNKLIILYDIESDNILRSLTQILISCKSTLTRICKMMLKMRTPLHIQINNKINAHSWLNQYFTSFSTQSIYIVLLHQLIHLRGKLSFRNNSYQIFFYYAYSDKTAFLSNHV